MDLIRWDPFGDLSTLRERVNRLFEETLARPDRREPASARTWAPLVDIYDANGDIVLRADLPGLKQEDIDLQLTGDTLTIRGERKLSEEHSYMRVERPHGNFERSFTLSVPIDQSKVKASYREGVLEIVLPKAEEAKPKQVKVEVG